MNIKLQKGDLIVWKNFKNRIDLVLTDIGPYYAHWIVKILRTEEKSTIRVKMNFIEKSIFRKIIVFRKDKQIFPKK